MADEPTGHPYRQAIREAYKDMKEAETETWPERWAAIRTFRRLFDAMQGDPRVQRRDLNDILEGLDRELEHAADARAARKRIDDIARFVSVPFGVLLVALAGIAGAVIGTLVLFAATYMIIVSGREHDSWDRLHKYAAEFAKDVRAWMRKIPADFDDDAFVREGLTGVRATLDEPQSATSDLPSDVARESLAKKGNSP